MSGINGIYYRNNRPVDCIALEKMASSLAHRGTDGAGIWYDGNIGLGNRLMWTSPESVLEELPLIHQQEYFILTADARIDNRAELLACLNLDDRPSAKVTDSQLILSAYEKWGECCPENLIGDFAFAIWDQQRQRLFCARDHYGLKPFYYFLTDDVFIFASEIKAILTLPKVPRRLSEIRVAQYLTGNFEDKVSTFYQDIVRLPPAHTLTLDQYGAKLAAYWSFDPTYELRLSSDEEYAEAYREIFTEAVRCRLRSAVPAVGSFLSGGLDSSSVTCVARDLLSKSSDRQLHSFSSVFDDVPESNERAFIDTVLNQGGLKAHIASGDEVSPLIDLDRVLWHEDGAFYAYNLFLSWQRFILAKEQGVRILLDGMLGDSTTSHGYQYLAELAHQRRWLTSIKEVQQLSKHYDYPLIKTASRNIWLNSLKPKVPHKVQRLTTKLQRQRSLQSKPRSILHPNFLRRLTIHNRPKQVKTNQTNKIALARQAHYSELTTGILPFALEIKNKAAAAFSLEICYPYSDKRLLEFCLSLPAGQKLQRGWPRSINRRALANLPEKIRWRTDKGDLAPNFKRGLLKYERDRLDDVILHNPQVIEDYVNLDELRCKYQRFTNQSQQLNNEDVSEIWLAATLALWLRSVDLEP